MLARQLEAQHSPACNDNGQFAPRRSAAPPPPPQVCSGAVRLDLGELRRRRRGDDLVGREHAERTSGIAGEPPRLDVMFPG